MTVFLDLWISMILNDLEPSKEGFWWIFRNFWLQRTFQHWIAMKWLETDQDNLHMKFLALHVDFSSPGPDPLGSKRPAQTATPPP